MLNSKPTASELCAVPSSWSDLTGQTFISVLAVTKRHILYYMLLRRHHRGNGKTPWQHCALHFTEIRLKQSSYPDVSSPSDWVLSPAQSPSYPTPEKWRLGARKYDWAGPWKTHAQAHLYSAVKISERFNLRDPIIGNFKEIKRTS